MRWSSSMTHPSLKLSTSLIFKWRGRRYVASKLRKNLSYFGSVTSFTCAVDHISEEFSLDMASHAHVGVIIIWLIKSWIWRHCFLIFSLPIRRGYLQKITTLGQAELPICRSLSCIMLEIGNNAPNSWQRDKRIQLNWTLNEQTFLKNAVCTQQYSSVTFLCWPFFCSILL